MTVVFYLLRRFLDSVMLFDFIRIRCYYNTNHVIFGCTLIQNRRDFFMKMVKYLVLFFAAVCFAAQPQVANASTITDFIVDHPLLNPKKKMIPTLFPQFEDPLKRLEREKQEKKEAVEKKAQIEAKARAEEEKKQAEAEAKAKAEAEVKRQEEAARIAAEEAAKAEARATEEAKAEAEVVAQTSQSVVQTIDVTASGYSSDGADAYCPGYITATGINLYEQPNVIAVNPSVIPLGTRVSIPGLGEYIAGDTGGAIGGSRIDIHFPTIAAALEWGMRNITIQILE